MDTCNMSGQSPRTNYSTSNLLLAMINIKNKTNTNNSYHLSLSKIHMKLKYPLSCCLHAFQSNPSVSPFYILQSGLDYVPGHSPVTPDTFPPSRWEVSGSLPVDVLAPQKQQRTSPFLRSSDVSRSESEIKFKVVFFLLYYE